MGTAVLAPRQGGTEAGTDSSTESASAAKCKRPLILGQIVEGGGDAENESPKGSRRPRVEQNFSVVSVVDKDDGRGPQICPLPCLPLSGDDPFVARATMIEARQRQLGSAATSAWVLAA